MKICLSRWRLAILLSLIALWGILWLLLPHAVYNRRTVDGVRWECGFVLHCLGAKEDVDAAKKMINGIGHNNESH